MLFLYALFALLVLLILDVAVFPMLVTKSSESESKGSRVFKFACYTLTLIIVLTAVFFVIGWLVTIDILWLPDSLINFFLVIWSPVINWLIIYFLTKQFKFIDSRGKRVAYSLLTTACLIMIFVCWMFTIPAD